MTNTINAAETVCWYATGLQGDYYGMEWDTTTTPWNWLWGIIFCVRWDARMDVEKQS